MKRLLLIRHGSVDRVTLQLNEDGRSFAAELPKLLSVDVLDCVCSDESDRCKDTVAPLADKFSLQVTVFHKDAFKSCAVLRHALTYCSSAVCYRIEAINPVLEALGLPEFSEASRNTAYEFIWNLSLSDSNSICSVNKVPTGFCIDGRQKVRVNGGRTKVND
jgi:hypothetical protein